MIFTKQTQTVQNIDFKEGHILLINKDLRWTSFDVVNKIRYMITKTCNLKKLKVGHGGTLDPLATGLVIIGIGKETKNLQDYQNEPKEYIAEIEFGKTTLTFDSEVEPTGDYETNHISKELIEECLHNHFSGKIEQIPPIFSAKNINGMRAYEHARLGNEIEMKAVSVEIYKHELLQYNNNVAQIKILCSKGTYIRSIANDLGIKLNSGAFLKSLIRTKSGGFDLNDSLTITSFEKILESYNS